MIFSDTASRKFLTLFFCAVAITAACQAPDSVIARQYYNEGITQSKKRNPEEANEILKKAASIYNALNLKEQYVSCQFAMATNYRNMADFQQSEAIATAMLSFVERNNLNRFSSVRFFKLLGQISSRIGEYDEAEAYFRKAISAEYRPSIPDSVFIGGIYLDLGNLSWRRHHAQEALDHYAKALPLVKERANQNMVKGNIANVYSDMKNYSRAITLLNAVIEDEIRAEGETGVNLRNHYQNLGQCYLDLFESYRALEYFEKALHLSESNLSDPAVPGILNNIGLVYLNTRDYEKARLYLDSSLTLHVKMYGKDSERLVPLYDNLGVVYEEQGRYETAFDYYRKSLRNSIQNADTFMIIRVYNKIGFLKTLENKCEEALSFLNEALKISHYFKAESEVHITHQRIATVQGRKKNYAGAIKSINDAMHHLLKGFSPKNLYTLPPDSLLFANYELLEMINSRAFFIKELAYRKKQDDLYLTALAAYQYAVIYFEKIENVYADEQSKVNLRKQFSELFENAIQLCHDLYLKTGKYTYMEKAFYFSEKNKATQLRHALLNQYAIKFSGISDSLIGRENDLRSLIYFYQQQLLEHKTAGDQKDIKDKLFACKTEHGRLIDLFKRKYPRFYELKYESQVASVQDVKELIPDQETMLIKYFAGDSLYYAFAVTKDKSAFYKIGLRQDIDKMVEEFLGAIRLQEFQSYTENAVQLYLKLVKPLEGAVPATHFIIIPDGKLYYVPFEALISHKPKEGETFKDLPYLVHSYDFRYHVSATLMKEGIAHARMKAEKKFAAFAPIEFNPSLNLPSLTGSETEARYAAQQMSGEYLIRDDATESVFKNMAADFAVLHLATHAVIDDEFPLKSRLLFSSTGDTLNDGVLHSYELYNLPLRAGLVTLSACNTGAGKLEEGEGVISLARAFMYAGSQSLLMSLWPASDKGSQLIMKFFYEELSDGKNKAEALRTAKVRYLQEADEVSADPFLWSNFVLVGDVEPLRPSHLLLWIGISAMVVLTLGYTVIRKKRIPGTADGKSAESIINPKEAI